MNGEVRLDPDSLRNQGARLAELGDRVGQTYTGLRDSLAHAEGSWGDDDLGLAFATEFKPHADQLLTNLRAMEESLHGTAAGIAYAANQFEMLDRYAADRVSTTADDLAPVGEQAPWPDGSAGTSAPAGAQSPVTPDAAATSPTPGHPAYPTDRVHPTEGSTPGGSRTPGGSAGRSTPEVGPRRDPSDPAAGRPGDREAGRNGDRAARGTGSGDSGKPAGDSGRRPPASAVFPPAATRNAPLPRPGGRRPVRRAPWDGVTPRGPGSRPGRSGRPRVPSRDPRALGTVLRPGRRNPPTNRPVTGVAPASDRLRIP